MCLLPFAKTAEKKPEKEEKKKVLIQEAEEAIEPPVTTERILDRLTMQEKEEAEAKALSKKVVEQTNRRQAFRVPLMDVECAYTIHPGGKKEQGTVADMSASGMKLFTPYDVPLQPNLYLTLAFTLQGKKYGVKGVPIRKKTPMKDVYEYGIIFQHDKPKQIEELHRALWQEQRKKSRTAI